MKTKTALLRNAMSLMLFSLFAMLTSAQPDHEGPPPEGPQKEKIESLRRAFYTQELNLSPTEAEKFWPVYLAFEDVKKQHHKNMKKLHDEEPQFIQSTADIEKFTKKLGILKQQESEQLYLYLKQSADAIGIEKTKLLIGIDERFRKEIGEHLRARKQNTKGQQQRRKR